MPKGTWKKRSVGAERIRDALTGSGGNVTRAAAALGVSRSTLHRWIHADASLHPGRRTAARGEAIPAPAGMATPEEFRRWALEAFEPTPAERQLLELALEALVMARDPGRNEQTRLAAMREFRMLLRDLKLEDPDETKADAAPSGRR